MSPADAWADLTTRCAEIAHLRSTAALLMWDQQVCLPDGGHAARGEQSALLARLVHERLVDDALSDDLAALAEAPDVHPDAAAVVRVLGRDVARARRVPSSLVSEMAQAESAGFGAWAKAKADDDFASFAPALSRIFDLKRAEAQAIDPDRPAYDVLLEAFDPGTTLEALLPMFDRLAAGLAPLIEGAADLPDPPAIDVHVPVATQRALHREVLEVMGFDFTVGRLDDSEHPFTDGVAFGDTRLTTHLYEGDVLSGLGGTLHEGGHGLYEQGLPKDVVPGTGLDQAAGLGLHESQSRFWENHIGRSQAFCRWLAGRMAEHLEVVVDPDMLYAASNPIQPSAIRVAADEATYNLHIIARVRLETAMLSGDLAIADLPGAWREQMRELLGLEVSTDREGCLQDVHWGSGAVGYFPSYTLGNLAAARMERAMLVDLPDLWDQVAAGELGSALAWLRDRVHRHGHRMEAPAIVAAATGERDGVADLLDHLWARHGALYGLTRPA